MSLPNNIRPMPQSSSGTPSTPAETIPPTAIPRLPLLSEGVSSVTTWPIASCGHPCAACQISVGAAMISAIPTPAQNIGRRSSRRGPNTSTQPSNAAHSRAIWNFVCIVMPITAPMASSSRSSARSSASSRSQRTSNHVSTIHNGTSMA